MQWFRKTCDLQTKDDSVAIMDTDDSMRFYGKPRTLTDFDIVGPEQSKPIIPQSDNREYVLLPENLNKPKEQGGPFYQYVLVLMKMKFVIMITNLQIVV